MLLKKLSCLLEAINHANLKIQDIDFLVPHQSQQELLSLYLKLGMPIEKIINTVDIHANTSVAHHL